MRDFRKKYGEYFVGPVIVLLILLVVFFLKSVFPFGDNTIMSGDVAQGYVPFYYFLHDTVYSGKNIFFDYSLGMGSNMYGGFVLDGLFNPISWVILLAPRNLIPFTLSAMLILSYMLIAFTSYLLFKRINPDNKTYNYLFSVLYALSAFTLMYNCNIMWLGVVALFPLLILALDHMFKKGKFYFFSVVLALILIFNFNMAYMVLMFLVFAVPIYIHFCIEKEQRKQAVFNLVIGTLFAVLLSAFAFVPALYQTITSYRYSGGSSGSISNTFFGHKLYMMLMYALPVFFYAKAAFSKKVKNMKVYHFALIMLALLPILIERINLWLHMGSYNMFPMRYAFVPILILYCGGLKYLSVVKEKKKEENKAVLFASMVFAVVVILLSVFNAVLVNNSHPTFNYLNTTSYICCFLGFAISLLVYGRLYNLADRVVSRTLIFAFTIIMVVCNVYAYVGIANKDSETNLYNGETVFYSQAIGEKMDEGLYRVKDDTIRGANNDALISRLPNMNTFLHIISPEQVINNWQMGYAGSYTQLYGVGGTIFTDAIYGVKYIITEKKLPERLYDLVEDLGDGTRIYCYKNLLSYGILGDNLPEFVGSAENKLSAFEANNYLYRELFDMDKDIITVDEVGLDKGDEEIEANVTADGAKELYLLIDKETLALIDSIKLNGEEYGFLTLESGYTTSFPLEERNGILDLGYYENETVDIKIRLNKDVLSEDAFDEDTKLLLGQLDIEKYEELFDYRHSISTTIEGNTIHITGKADDDTSIFLPIIYNDGFLSEVGVRRVLNAFIAVPLKKGQNDITITFVPKYFKLSLGITICTIVVMGVLALAGKRFDIRNNKLIVGAVYYLGCLIVLLFVYKFYIESIVLTMIDLVK